MLKAFGRSTSGIHARPRKMVRFCCSVKPSQLWWGLPHPHHQLDFPHYPSKIANTLASLVKGEVLSPKKFGRLPEELPHLPYPFRFSDTSVNNPSFRTQPSQNRTIPRKPPTPLPPLSKVRCCRPKKFGRLPEGLLHPLAPHQPFQTRTIPPAFRVVSSTAPLPTK